MENHKEEYFREFCKRSEMNLENLKDLLHIYKTTEVKANCEKLFNEKQIEEHIRNSYAENSKLGSNEYMKIIMLDAVFIIELFLRDFSMKEAEEKEKLYEDDYLLKNQWLKNSIQQDLLLLENQLPFILLNQLYKKAFPANHKPTFDDLTLHYFKEYNRQKVQNLPDNILHFTDLLRHFMFHNHPKASKNTSRNKIQASAVKLSDAGVNFELNENACCSDIRFKTERWKWKLQMPRFVVDNTTECVLRNIIAYEQWHYSSEAHISNYIFLIGCLINTAKDVELLRKKGIIVHWLGSNEEVVKLFKDLYINITKYTKYNSCYHDICDKLNDHYESLFSRTIQRTVPYLRDVYFSNIWRGTSTAAAVILLVLTLLQTICSFMSLR